MEEAIFPLVIMKTLRVSAAVERSCFTEMTGNGVR